MFICFFLLLTETLQFFFGHFFRFQNLLTLVTSLKRLKKKKKFGRVINHFMIQFNEKNRLEFFFLNETVTVVI